MFEACVETRFRARHSLTLAEGLKEPAHTHNWSVRAEVAADALDGRGLVMDFGLLKELLDQIVAQFAGGALEQTDYFRQNNPSAEMVAKYVYEKLRPGLPENVTLNCVTVAEHDGCWAKYSE